MNKPMTGGKESVGLKRLKQDDIPEDLTALLSSLTERGFNGYVVGGAVRDLLLGRTPKDWDVATDAEPEMVHGIFPKVVFTGKRFGTVKVYTGERWVEVTTYRQDGPYRDGRRPEWVRFSKDIETDLRRRDFTVNAIAYDPIQDRMVDPTNGIFDLKRRLLRAIGEPRARFQEDALRMVRFYRLQSQLEFKGERSTELAIEAQRIKAVSPERIRDELSRLLLTEKPALGLNGLLKAGLMQEISPELAAMAGVGQGSLHRWDVWGHAVAAVEAIRPGLELRWAALLHDVGKPQTRFEDDRGIHFYGHDQRGAEISEGILRRLAYPKAFVLEVAELVRHHMFYYGPEVTDAALRRLASRVGLKRIPSILELRRADIIATHERFDRAWESYKACRDRLLSMVEGERVFTLKDLAINGQDLKEAFGWLPGPRYRVVLESALQWVLEDPERNQKKILLAYIQGLPEV